MTMSDTSGASSLSARPDRSMVWRQQGLWVMNAPGVLPVATFVLVLVLWEVGCRVFAIPSFVLPSPSRIVGGFDAVSFAGKDETQTLVLFPKRSQDFAASAIT